MSPSVKKTSPRSESKPPPPSLPPPPPSSASSLPSPSSSSSSSSSKRTNNNNSSAVKPPSLSGDSKANCDCTELIDDSLSSSVNSSVDSSKGDSAKPDVKPAKRKYEPGGLPPDEDAFHSPSSKKVKPEQSSSAPAKSEADSKAVNGPSSAPAPHRKNNPSANSSRSSHRPALSSNSSSTSSSSSSKKPRRSSSTNSREDLREHDTQGSSRPLPFNHYVNGTTDSSPVSATAATTTTTTTSNSTSSGGDAHPNSYPNLPSPSPVETQMMNSDYYIGRAREHKHRGDKLNDKTAQFENYLRAGLSFFLAGYSFEKKNQPTESGRMFTDTCNLLQHVVRRATNSSSDMHGGDKEKEKKLIVLSMRLQSLLYYRLFRLKRAEVSKLKKIIETESSKQSTTAQTNSAQPSASSRSHAPSPHQSNWNKNSTGTPSPMSPTPSPGSVSSQGSCELMNNKMPNGGAPSTTPTPVSSSPSPGMISVPVRMHSMNQKYFSYTSHMVKAHELWDQANTEMQGLEEFFNQVDARCMTMTYLSEPFDVVRYIKDALRLLNYLHPSSS